MRKLLFVSLFVILLSGCRDTEHTDQKNEPVQKHETGSGEKEEAAASGIVSLNNGEKWSANPETTTGINKMSALLEELPAQPNADEYHGLKGKMDAEFNLILKNCTMKGEAHNQLHNYLLSLPPLFQKLDSQDADVRETAMTDMKKHLGEYKNYFN
jgi:hypothetical protein